MVRTNFDGGPEGLAVESIQAGLATEKLGRNLVFLARTESTNTEARRLAESGAPEGTVVVADFQTAGKGRLGRRWEAPPGTSILMSLVLRPDLEPQQAQRLTMICGLGVVDAIKATSGLDAALKWPNDVLVRGEKIGGILTELGLAGNGLEFAVVGVGLNVNMRPEVIPNPLVPATSLSHILGRSVERAPVLCSFLKAVEQRYFALRSGYLPHEEWSALLATLGHTVRVRSSHSEIRGLAEGVDENGALLVRLDDNTLTTVWAGDVTFHGKA
jgi:BirA family biotin operon repressor/biotin-[acetyl-CoA-carboxylase] ligase